MAKRGRKPKPTAQKIAEGNPGRRPINGEEPKFTKFTKGATPPVFLSKQAKIEWRRVYKELARLQMVAKVDRGALAMYCQEYAIYVEAVEQIKKEGMSYPILTEEGELKCIVQHPAVGIKNKALMNCMKIAVEFGFTPSSRSGLKIPTEKEQNAANVIGFLDGTS